MHIEPSKIDLAPWGYAPGWSLFYCEDCCSAHPEQGHKDSTKCIRHALAARAMVIPVDVIPIIPELQECKSQLKLKIMILGSVAIGGATLGFLL